MLKVPGRHLWALLMATLLLGWLVPALAPPISSRLLLGSGRLGQAIGSQPSTPPAAKRLDQIASSMQPGWLELPSAAISPVLPTRSEVEWGTTGPASVILAWNGAAYDPESRSWYLHGGGPPDYGGNEVYRFSFVDLAWKRLTNPAPYPAATRDPSAGVEQRCPYPVDGPPSMHTYSGKVFSPRTRTLFMAPTTPYCPSGIADPGPSPGLWEFNPSETQTRNGLRPLQWRHHRLDVGLRGWPHAAALDDGRIALGDNSIDLVFDPVTNRVVHSTAPAADEGDGTMVFDAKRRTLWLLNRSGLQRLSYRNGQLSQRTNVTHNMPGGMGFSSGMALHEPTGKLVFWNGRKITVTFDPDTARWELNDHRVGPSSPSSTVYTKWIYLRDHDIFAGYQIASSGVYLYRLPSAGQPLTEQTLQAIIDAAPSGSRVKVPAGIYPTGAIIRKPLSLDLAGVRILEPVGDKAAIVVSNATDVVLENLTSAGLYGGANYAAVRAEGKFDVTIRRAHISDNEAGILTDNRGGRVVVEDSLIENIGYADSDLGHLIYAGAIDELVVRHSTLRLSRNLGHIVKSRAKRTVITHSYLLGLDGPNSRELDVPCGGEVIVRDSVLQKGSSSDNAEMIGFAGEANAARNCPIGLYANSSVTLERNWIIFDRQTLSGNGNRLMIDFSRGKASLQVNDNRIVNMREWGFAPIPRRNTIFSERSAAGLPAYPALPPIR